MPRDVVITHDGKLLFAYAADQATLTRRARRDREVCSAQDGIRRDRTRQPLGRRAREVAPDRSAATGRGAAASTSPNATTKAVETRTLVVSSGKMIRAEFEQSMREWADKLQLECTIVEHPHLLTTQVAFTVTGPKRKIDEFSTGARRRGVGDDPHPERTVMMSPL